MLSLWVFLTPFITIGSGMLLALFSTLAGKTVVRISQGEGSVYVGIDALGWTRRFDPAQVKRVELGQRTWRNTDADPKSQTEIHLEEKTVKVLKFGSLLNEERQQYVSTALRQLML